MLDSCLLQAHESDEFEVNVQGDNRGGFDCSSNEENGGNSTYSKCSH